MFANNQNLTGYGPRSRLLFDGDERNYETWEVRFLGYLHLNGLKSTILTSASGTPDAAKNEKAYSELVQVLDERSLSLIMRMPQMMVPLLYGYSVNTIVVRVSLAYLLSTLNSPHSSSLAMNL